MRNDIISFLISPIGRELFNFSEFEKMTKKSAKSPHSTAVEISVPYFPRSRWLSPRVVRYILELSINWI